MVDTLNRICPSCGKESPPDLPNCVHCGTRFPPPGTPVSTTAPQRSVTGSRALRVALGIPLIGCGLIVTVIAVAIASTAVVSGHGWIVTGVAMSVVGVTIVASGAVLARRGPDRVAPQLVVIFLVCAVLASCVAILAVPLD